MLSWLVGSRSKSAPQIGGDLMWEIITDLKVDFPESQTRWEILERYARRCGDSYVLVAIQKAVNDGVIIEDSGQLIFNPAHA